MNWFILIVGVLIGSGGYYLYDRYWGTIESRLKALNARAVALEAKLKGLTQK